MSFDKDTFARNLRVKRAERDITQGGLADAVGLNICTIVQYEDGGMVPGADKVFLLAEALGCTPNDLLGWKA